MTITYVKNMSKKFWGHLRTVQTHRKWVRHYCFALDMPIQGILHDLSKYNPVEFWEGVKYWQGNRSPIDACKEANGYSMAWFHHRGRNKHHYEYWCDNFDKGCTTNLMPKKYFMELVADYLGAGRAYMGENFTFTKEYEWWQNKRKNPLKMDERQLVMLDTIFRSLAEMETPAWRIAWSNMTPEEYLASPAGRMMISNIYEKHKNGVNYD